MRATAQLSSLLSPPLRRFGRTCVSRIDRSDDKDNKMLGAIICHRSGTINKATLACRSPLSYTLASRRRWHHASHSREKSGGFRRNVGSQSPDAVNLVCANCPNRRNHLLRDLRHPPSRITQIPTGKRIAAPRYDVHPEGVKNRSPGDVTDGSTCQSHRYRLLNRLEAVASTFGGCLMCRR